MCSATDFCQSFSISSPSSPIPIEMEIGEDRFGENRAQLLLSNFADYDTLGQFDK